ncbi:MAG: choice-of-anchor tandem repeat GloVer-containing protein [Candidatus Sulfotelmatobacter sp.]
MLHSFSGGADGRFPSGGVVLDPVGNLYGTTVWGGCDGYGVVFKLTPNPDGTWTETVLHPFLGFGRYPWWAGVIMDAAGNLYGTTSDGSNNYGIVFEITP